MVRIAIPEPTSADPEYNGRALPPYIDALRGFGAEPLVIALNEPQDRVARLLASVQGILLPGSRYDVDPQRYGEGRISRCGPADQARTAVDELFLQEAFNLHKPILAICHGAQTLNVWRNGALIQDLETCVDHQPGRNVVEAHPVRLASGSRLARLAGKSETEEVQVNSSHHQAIRVPGDNLRVTAVSAEDGVIEAVELDSTNHFVLGVQWHPERTIAESPLSSAIFSAFVRAAESWQAPAIEAAAATRRQ
jgi:putative glutamine amidotransferase